MTVNQLDKRMEKLRSDYMEELKKAHDEIKRLKAEIKEKDKEISRLEKKEPLVGCWIKM